MRTLTNNSFLTSRDWHEAVLANHDVVLCHASALEHLGLWGGYLSVSEIDVYSLRPGEYENITYHIINTFDGIDTISFGGTRCTTINQTFNDMIADFDNVDEQALLEGLSHYYYTHGESFDGLEINSENFERFNEIKNWAIEYYDEV